MITFELVTLSGIKHDEDVFEVLTLEGSVAARNHLGGTAPEQVRAQVEAARATLKNKG